MNKLSTIPNEVIMSKIYFIRGQKVMLDSDIADLYGVETRKLNQAVLRNEYRFPEDFMFRLSEKEWEILISQNVTSSWGGRRKLPYVFTEHGVLMLSSVLNSKKAIEVNIQIMRIFTRIRKMLTENTELRMAIDKLDKKSENHSKNIEILFRYYDELIEKRSTTRGDKKSRKYIGYKLPKKKKT